MPREPVDPRHTDPCGTPVYAAHVGWRDHLHRPQGRRGIFRGNRTGCRPAAAGTKIAMSCAAAPRRGCGAHPIRDKVIMSMFVRKIVTAALVLPTLVACTVAQDEAAPEPPASEAQSDQTETIGQVSEGLTAGCAVTSSFFTPIACASFYCRRTSIFRMTLACTQADCARVVAQSVPSSGLPMGGMTGFVRTPSDYACVGEYIR